MKRQVRERESGGLLESHNTDEGRKLDADIDSILRTLCTGG